MAQKLFYSMKAFLSNVMRKHYYSHQVHNQLNAFILKYERSEFGCVQHIIGQRIFGSHHRMFDELRSAMTVTIHALTLACGIETFTFAKPVEAAGWLGPASGISPTLVDDP